MNRIGIGYDLHRLVENESLILGGVEIDHALGLKGHSDADVLVHALIDALLGAAAMGDIGEHFPPTDERYRGIDSLGLLARVNSMLVGERCQLANADMVIIAENPKLAPYLEQMRKNIAGILEVPLNRVSVKATTTEGLGVCGRNQGMAAQAVVMLEKCAPPGPAGPEAK